MSKFGTNLNRDAYRGMAAIIIEGIKRYGKQGLVLLVGYYGSNATE